MDLLTKGRASVSALVEQQTTYTHTHVYTLIHAYIHINTHSPSYIHTNTRTPSTHTHTHLMIQPPSHSPHTAFPSGYPAPCPQAQFWCWNLTSLPSLLRHVQSAPALPTLPALPASASQNSSLCPSSCLTVSGVVISSPCLLLSLSILQPRHPAALPNLTSSSSSWKPSSCLGRGGIERRPQKNGFECCCQVN